jgi:hypothetical protein
LGVGVRKLERTGKKPHKEELYEYFSANIIWMINSRKMMWSGLVARTEYKRNTFRALV